MKTSILIATAALCGLINADSIQAQSGQELFQQALAMERSSGHVRDAIPLYERIVAQFASDRSLAANALIRLGYAHEALGSSEAKSAYQRIVSDYADQRGQMDVARSRLDALATEAVVGADGRVRPVLRPSALCGGQPAAAIATFEDPNLERKVRSALLIGARDDLTCGLVSELTELDASYTESDASSAEIERIESLLGIQNLTGLTWLSLFDNSITDISPLSGLTSLTSLRIGLNSISDMSPLSGLTSLTLETISSDATIDDATYESGIDVDSGATVTINSPAELGFTNIVTEPPVQVTDPDPRRSNTSGPVCTLVRMIVLSKVSTLSSKKSLSNVEFDTFKVVPLVPGKLSKGRPYVALVSMKSLPNVEFEMFKVVPLVPVWRSMKS